MLAAGQVTITTTYYDSPTHNSLRHSQARTAMPQRLLLPGSTLFSPHLACRRRFRLHARSPVCAV